ncbi:hypothetical protein FRX31_035373 [Thalictrum thalictroides]|uniref:DUF4283 domain-containing protein n=1 Tax=Thalictrum thalictroides TaxID=46969 RepID=A0A7J6UR86_THATH|nr:hypothetical protein FRX31_035373 [Thalictrum thalictroides]
MGQTRDHVEPITQIVPVPRVRKTTIPPLSDTEEEQPVIISAWPKPYMSWRSKTNTVEVLSKGLPFGAAWWSSVVLCSGSLSNDCWVDVEDKVKEKFGMREFKLLSDQKAAIFLNSDEDATRLSLMPHLCLGGVVFSFAMWKPECGSLWHISGKDWCLNMIGFPLHLKNCIRSVAGVLGKVLEVDMESISMESMKVRVQIHRDNIFDLPRCVSLVENEVVFPIMVEIESPESRWVDRGLCYFSGSKRLFSVEEEVVGSTVLAREMKQTTLEGQNSNYTDIALGDGTQVGNHGLIVTPNSHMSLLERVGSVVGVGIGSSSDANGARSLSEICAGHVDEHEVRVWANHLAIPLAPMIGVSKRVDGTYGDENFIKIVLKQKEKEVGSAASND